METIIRELVADTTGLDPVALMCDRYEFTMVDAALRSGAGTRLGVFEAFTRSLPAGRRFGVLAGTGRIIEALRDFRFDDRVLGWLDNEHVVSAATLDWLAAYRFDGNIDGYAEGDLFFPNSPVLTVTAPFAVGTLLETLILSIINADSAVASAAARMRLAAGGRTLIEMGSRRANEHAAVAAARAAYIAGFDATSNLAASYRYGIPSVGTAAHAFTLAHSALVAQGDTAAAERAAFDAQIDALGVGTSLLVDTYDIDAGIRHAVEAARAHGAAGPGAIRIDSGDPHIVIGAARRQLDELGADATRIVLTGDLDEHVIASLADTPVDTFGAGTKVVTGSGAPTCGFVYKLVAVEHQAGQLIGVAKHSASKASTPGVKLAWRHLDTDGYADAEQLSPRFAPLRPAAGNRITLDSCSTRGLQHRLIDNGEPVADTDAQTARTQFFASIAELRPEHRDLTNGEAAFTAGKDPR